MKNHILHEKREFTDIRALLEWAGDFYGEKIAYSYRKSPSKSEKTEISFAKFRDDVRALSSELISRGYSGKHCALIGKFSYDWAVIYYSVLSIGGVLVPLDRDWLANDLAETALRADVSFIFCDSDIADKLSAVEEKCTLEGESILICTKDESEGLAPLIMSGREKTEEFDYRSIKIDPYKMSLLVFTSGTTGKGKGVMLSQNAVLSDISAVVPYVDFSDKTVGVLPPHHTYGSSVMLAGHIMIGSEVYISSGIRYVQKELKEEKPGHLVLVPLYLETFYRKIMANIKEQGKEKLVSTMIKTSNLMRKGGIDLRKKLFSAVRDAFGGEVKMIISGGAPINPDIIAFFEAIGISVLNGYGITECAPIIAVNRSRNVVAHSVGNVIDIDDVKIDSPNEDGEGEIWVTGPNIMLGYYRDEKATFDAVTEDGYFKTGDYGKLDKNGVLYITGRKKNLIILSNGKNVYPEEIENELISIPGILDIVVYEGKSRRGMEHNAIVAEIYPDSDFMEKNGISDFRTHIKPFIDEYNRNTVPYKKIGVLKVRHEEFPKNTLRKIMRFKIDMTIE